MCSKQGKPEKSDVKTFVPLMIHFAWLHHMIAQEGVNILKLYFNILKLYFSKWFLFQKAMIIKEKF